MINIIDNNQSLEGATIHTDTYTISSSSSGDGFDLGAQHKYRYIKTSGLIETPTLHLNKTYNENISNDLIDITKYASININVNVPDPENTDTYTISSPSSGDGFDLGVNNLVRYIKTSGLMKNSGYYTSKMYTYDAIIANTPIIMDTGMSRIEGIYISINNKTYDTMFGSINNSTVWSTTKDNFSVFMSFMWHNSNSSIALWRASVNRYLTHGASTIGPDGTYWDELTDTNYSSNTNPGVIKKDGKVAFKNQTTYSNCTIIACIVGIK